VSEQQPNNGPVPAPWARVALIAAMAGLLAILYFGNRLIAPPVEIPYSEFKELLSAGQVSRIELREDLAEVTLVAPAPLGPEGERVEQVRTRLPPFGDERLLADVERQGVELHVHEVRRFGLAPWLLLITLPTLLILGLIVFMLARTTQGAGGVGRMGELDRFLKSSVKEAKVPKVRFADVAGQETAKREVSELVRYLRDPQSYRRLGAEVPRGVLLMGPPGTGKTLLAKALAGEAGVPFFSISGSEFIEVFVGVGAARVRKLFEAAKRTAPSIIFIDELDSIGRTRGTGVGGGHDEREQTLNQILAEMDGFAEHEPVIVLSATNRPDVLDPALLRPGRFDRHVTLDLPDRAGRRAILDVHVRAVPLGDDVDLDKLAAGTPGFSGADLKNVVNEAAMMAAGEGASQVSMHHLDEARDKLLLGAARTLAIQPEERHRLAVHESGHTLVAYFLEHADPLYKVTIIPRGRALGGTHQLPEQERHTLPEEYLHARLTVSLAGRVAEREQLGSVSSGADDDIRQATELARAMVARWGMAESVGPVDLRTSETHPFLGREIAQPRHYSERSAEAVDEAVRELLTGAEQQALELIRSHRVRLARLVDALEEHETLHRTDIEECLGPAPLKEPARLVSPEPDRRGTHPSARRAP
jgi:cell division protease FtsH